MTAVHRLSQLGDFSPRFSDAAALHLGLARWNRQRMALGPPAGDWRAELAEDAQMAAAETAFIEAFRAHLAPMTASLPTARRPFIAWFEELKHVGPGQGDPLFAWLRDDADMAAMKWFLTQEAAGEAGFDDLVAMTQVKLPPGPKLELARNYWDEMGRGTEAGMHGPMLERTVSGLGLAPGIESTVWPSLALANTMTALAMRRRYALHALGALGVVELTAPDRVAAVAAGLKRLGVAAQARKYFQLHAHLDVEHARAWLAQAISPLVSAHPDYARPIAEGALMRLTCGAACFEVYRAHLWGGVSQAAE